ncbi:DHR13 reductase, partial [Hemiprocne comata]|nr:DHR13 reductase [Hemiprocne comata]
GMGWALLGAGLLLALYTLLRHGLRRALPPPARAVLRGRTAIVTGERRWGRVKSRYGPGGLRCGPALTLCFAPFLRGKRRHRGGHGAGETGNPEVRFMHLDLASLQSVRAFASTFLRQEPHLHLLINNAGVSAGGTTEDGFSLSFQVNHLGHFLLTQLLLERLQSSAPSRVVIVASSAHCAGHLRLNALGHPPPGMFSTFQDYCDSKLANVLHARELATRLEGTQVTCYAVHPGFVDTELFRHAPLWLKPLLLPLVRLFFRSAAEGARTPLHCAVQDGIEPLSGRYFADCRPQEPWPPARDDRLAQALWEASEKLVGLGDTEGDPAP